MSNGARLVIGLFCAAILGFLLATAQHARNWPEWQVLVFGDIVFALWIMAFLPWFVTGMGWISLWRNRERIRETGQIK